MKPLGFGERHLSHAVDSGLIEWYRTWSRNSGPLVQVGSTMVERAESELRTTFGDGVDVLVMELAPSALDEKQLADVLSEHWADWRILTLGGGIDDMGYPYTELEVSWVVPELADFAKSLPGGILEIWSSVSPA